LLLVARRLPERDLVVTTDSSFAAVAWLMAVYTQVVVIHLCLDVAL
jgi:hypothetical protein